VPNPDATESTPQTETRDLRLEFKTAHLLSPAEGTASTQVHMQPFVRPNGGRWKKAGCGLIADSISDHLRTVDFALEHDQFHMVLDPKAHLGKGVDADA
jgi:hypothetical protein